MLLSVLYNISRYITQVSYKCSMLVSNFLFQIETSISAWNSCTPSKNTIEGKIVI